jgi:tetratricopeptide (TPR) repeat protein
MTLALSTRPAAAAIRSDATFASLGSMDLTLASPSELAQTVASLEQACREQPSSASLWTCLGIAYAVGYDVHKAIDALETATEVEPDHFWAQLKHGELQYRLRVLVRAEASTLKAETLATDVRQLALARRQLKEIRRLTGGKSLQPGVDKPKRLIPTILFTAIVLIAGLASMWS